MYGKLDAVKIVKEESIKPIAVERSLYADYEKVIYSYIKTVPAVISGEHASYNLIKNREFILDLFLSTYEIYVPESLADRISRNILRLFSKYKVRDDCFALQIVIPDKVYVIYINSRKFATVTSLIYFPEKTMSPLHYLNYWLILYDVYSQLCDPNKPWEKLHSKENYLRNYVLSKIKHKKKNKPVKEYQIFHQRHKFIYLGGGNRFIINKRDLSRFGKDAEIKKKIIVPTEELSKEYDVKNLRLYNYLNNELVFWSKNSQLHKILKIPDNIKLAGVYYLLRDKCSQIFNSNNIIQEFRFIGEWVDKNQDNIENLHPTRVSGYYMEKTKLLSIRYSKKIKKAIKSEKIFSK